MAEKKRQCGTCRFFVETGIGGHGKCTHPKRAGADAELLLLRPTELACRTKWGTHLWQDPADDSDPNKQDSPQQPTLPEPIAAQLQFDDEVTSVSIAGSKSARPSNEDDVVDSGAVATGMASWNDPVQNERLDLLRKSNHDALAGAHKRHMEKRARQREMVPFADDTETTSSAKPEPEPELKPNPEPVVKPAASSKPSFPADDFVEEEYPAAKDESSFEDEMVDEGINPERNRSPRLRNLLREPKDPKRDEAMHFSMPSEMKVTSNNPDKREQWNSVPTLNPSFELPLSKPADRPSAAPRVAASAAPVANTSYQPRPLSQARELLSEDRLRQERAQRQVIAPLADEQPRTQGPRVRVEPESEENDRNISRQKLTEAPASDTAPIERIKSSPLRGYHPATRKLNQPVAETSEPQNVPEGHTLSPRPQAQPPQPRMEQPVQRSRPTQPRMEQPVQPRPPRMRADDRREQRPMPASPVQEDTRSRPQSEDHAPAGHTAPPRGREPRPYIPMQELAPSTPFVREEIEIAPDVPRMCGTCTSYRPSGVPGRGSCTNAFAGPVQRVVYEQDLSCEHTFGAFWLPADEEVWLDELPDTSAPTPRVDAMLARRRRRKPTVLPDLEELTS